jgi:ribosomal protein L7Ae-like RNA K-turn-binding protein
LTGHSETATIALHSEEMTVVVIAEETEIETAIAMTEVLAEEAEEDLPLSVVADSEAPNLDLTDQGDLKKHASKEPTL